MQPPIVKRLCTTGVDPALGDSTTYMFERECKLKIHFNQKAIAASKNVGVQLCCRITAPTLREYKLER